MVIDGSWVAAGDKNMDASRSMTLDEVGGGRLGSVWNFWGCGGEYERVYRWVDGGVKRHRMVI